MVMARSSVRRRDDTLDFVQVVPKIDKIILVFTTIIQEIWSLFVTQYVSQIETRLRTILIIKRVRVIFSHTDDLFYGKNTFCLF